MPPDTIFDREVETRPWEDQHRLDHPLFRRQLDYLFNGSRFHRSKLVAAGINAALDAGGLDEITALPFTEKDELRATRTEEDPVGTHLIPPLNEIARVFSTSGTTGAPEAASN